MFGAAGAVGKALAPVLAREDVPFRVVGRDAERLRRDFARYDPLVEVHAADLNDPSAAANAAAGIDTIFYLVGVPYGKFAEHPKLSRIALEGAAKSGVKRFVHVSTVYPYGMPEREFVDEMHSRKPHTFKGRMRKEQEDLVLAANGKNGMRTVIVRPPDFYGPTAEQSVVRAIFDAALKGGTANVIGPIDMPHEFIFVPDLAETLWAVANTEEAFGRAWNIGGPGLITTQEFAELVFSAVGKQPELRAAGKTMLRVLGLFNPLLRELVEMHYLWTSPVALDDSRLRTLLPHLKKTSYEDGIKRTLAAMQAGS